MLYLDLPGLYLDIHHVARKAKGLQVCALLGDGCDEGEVLLALGAETEVAFADMLPDSGLPELLRRHGREAVRQALLAAAPVVAADWGAVARPHVYRPASAASPCVCEGGAAAFLLPLH